MASKGDSKKETQRERLASGLRLGELCAQLEVKADTEEIIRSMREVEKELERLKVSQSDERGAERLGMELCERGVEVFVRALSPGWAPLLRKPPALNWGHLLGSQLAKREDTRELLRAMSEAGLKIFGEGEIEAADWLMLAKSESIEPIQAMLDMARQELGAGSDAYEFHRKGALVRALQRGGEKIFEWAREIVKKERIQDQDGELILACLRSAEGEAMEALAELVEARDGKWNLSESMRNQIARAACLVEDPMIAIKSLEGVIDWGSAFEPGSDEPLQCLCYRETLSEGAQRAIKKFESLGYGAKAWTTKVSLAGVACGWLPWEQASESLGLKEEDWIQKNCESSMSGEGRIDPMTFAIRSAPLKEAVRKGESDKEQARLIDYAKAAMRAAERMSNEERAERLDQWVRESASSGLPRLMEAFALERWSASGSWPKAKELSWACSMTPMGKQQEAGRRACVERAIELGMDLNEAWVEAGEERSLAKTTIEGLLGREESNEYAKLLGERLRAMARGGMSVTKWAPKGEEGWPRALQEAGAIEEAVELRKQLKGKEPAREPERKRGAAL